MRSNSSRPLFISTTLILILALLPVTPAYAADLLSISPSTIVNNIDNIITVTGSGFDNTALVLLDGSTLSTTPVDATTLTAIIPSGLAAGSYKITVSMTGATVNGFAVLTVNVPPTPVPTNTPIPTSTTAPLPFTRPQFVVRQAKPLSKVQTGTEFKLKVVMENAGNATAYSVQAAFASADLVPTKNGGIAVLGVVANDNEVEFTQSFYVSAQITSKTIIVTDLTVTYYDDKGASYSDKFTLSIPVSGGTVSTGGGVYATATPTGVKSSQLVITGYSASVDPLQPGQQFDLKLAVQNVGNLKAQRITMIVGGGSSGTSGGTPQPGGVSGGSGDFANFAPVGASNVQSLGDLAAGDKTQALQSLIVNVTTNPGAYPMKISFSYLNAQGDVVNDDQVITLLVYSLPNVDISFYRPLDSLFVGQPGALPLQVVNLGKRVAVLGNIKVSAKNGQVDNGAGLVGSLEAGGYFTLDSTFTPEQSGAQTLDISIEYLDDFNQPRTITKTVDIDVQEGVAEPTPDPFVIGGGGGSGDMSVPEETTMHKIFRFIKGLFGLDSAWPVWQAPSGGGVEKPGETVPVIPPGKGG